MFDSHPLEDARRAFYAKFAAQEGWAGFAFVPVLPVEGDKLPGQGGALGLAKANESGYFPIPCAWAHYATWDDAEADAERLNTACGIDPETAMRVIVSTMGGVRFYGAAQ